MSAANAGAPLSQRGEIRLGFRCNARCGFCYYMDLLDTPKEEEPTTAQLMRQIELLRRSGATEVEFTGGEPTIRSDLVDLTRHAKSLGFAIVSVISNGLRLANPRYAQELVEAGVSDFLLSIHGHTPELHDAHTQIPGSHVRIEQALRNVKALGARCRSSTTVTAHNHRHMEAIVGRLLDLGVDGVHLAVFSPVAQASNKDFGMAVSYADAAHFIKRAIDAHQARLPTLSVKYIPFCLMQGYERYVMNLYQQSFDPDDWNYYFSNKVRRGERWWKGLLFDAAVLAGGLASKHFGVARRHGLAGWKVLGLTRVVELTRKQRTAACRRCSYRIVCDGPWKEYTAKFGEAEFTAVEGPLQTDPAWCYELAHSRSPGVPLALSPRAPATAARGLASVCVVVESRDAHSIGI